MTDIKVKVRLHKWSRDGINYVNYICLHPNCYGYRCCMWDTMLGHLYAWHSPFDFVEIECDIEE